MTPGVLLSLVLFTAVPATPIPETLGPALSALSRIRPDVRVGEWVTYQMQRGPKRQAFLRLAVVGEEPDSRGRPAYWLELEVGDHAALRAPLAQLRLLVTRSVGFRPEGISRVFIALAHAPAYELPPTAIDGLFKREPRSPPRPPPAAAPVSLRHGAPQSRMTFARTLQATPVELHSGARLVQRVWLSPMVPVLQIASVELPVPHQSLDVREYGLDAQPRMRLPGPDSGTMGIEPKGTP